jgi:hypothetical protein
MTSTLRNLCVFKEDYDIYLAQFCFAFRFLFLGFQKTFEIGKNLFAKSVLAIIQEVIT